MIKKILAMVDVAVTPYQHHSLHLLESNETKRKLTKYIFKLNSIIVDKEIQWSVHTMAIQTFG